MSFRSHIASLAIKLQSFRSVFFLKSHTIFASFTLFFRSLIIYEVRNRVSTEQLRAISCHSSLRTEKLMRADCLERCCGSGRF